MHERFGPYEIAQDASGSPLTFNRGSKELCCVGFDPRHGHLVELHIPHRGKYHTFEERASFLRRCAAASELRHPALVPTMEFGDHEGIPFYALPILDGEPLHDYLGRAGPIHPIHAVALAQDLASALVDLQQAPSLLPTTNLWDALVLPGTSLPRLVLADFGLPLLSPVAPPHQETVARLLFDCACLVLDLMHGARQADRDAALKDLPLLAPSPLLHLLREVLQERPGRPKTLERFSQLLSSSIAGATRGPALLPPPPPRRPFAHLLIGEPDLAATLGARYELLDDPAAEPFQIPARDREKDRPVLLQILPPERVFGHGSFTPVHVAMGRVSPSLHPNILRALGVWENDDFQLVAEEATPGLALSQILAVRGKLDQAELPPILHQLRAALGQAEACGLLVTNLHPSNIILSLPDASAAAARRVVDLNLSRWPEFVLKLRTHVTTRNLLDLPPEASEEPPPAHIALRCRFVGLTTQLLSGQPFALPENLPEALHGALERAIDACLAHRGRDAPPIDAVVAAFDAPPGDPAPSPHTPTKRPADAGPSPQAAPTTPAPTYRARRFSSWGPLALLALLLLIGTALALAPALFRDGTTDAGDEPPQPRAAEPQPPADPARPPEEIRRALPAGAPFPPSDLLPPDPGDALGFSG